MSRPYTAHLPKMCTDYNVFRKHFPTQIVNSWWESTQGKPLLTKEIFCHLKFWPKWKNPKKVYKNQHFALKDWPFEKVISTQIINSLWGQTRGKLPVTKEIFSHLKFSTGCIPSSQIQEKSQKSIFGPKWWTCWKCFFTSNCDFLMRTHPKQAMYDKRNFFQPHVFTGVHTPVAKFKKSNKKPLFDVSISCWLAACFWTKF